MSPADLDQYVQRHMVARAIGELADYTYREICRQLGITPAAAGQSPLLQIALAMFEAEREPS